MTTTATKAITVFLTGATAWAGVNLPTAWATGFGVISATILAFVVPNTAIPQPWNPPAREGGYADIVSIVVVIILLLIVLRIFGLV